MAKNRLKKRAVKGTRTKPVAKSFNCSNCGAPVSVEIVGHTLNVVCPSCRSIIDARDPNYKILQKASERKTETPYLLIGQMGKLKGIKWKISGFMVKSDSGYYWREYLLYNPYHGYRWLVEVDGHWTFYKKIYRSVDDHGDTVSYKGKKFKMFNKGAATVRYVEGEFYWRVKRGDSTHMVDYISPPEALSVERSDHEENWSLGIYIEGETIRKAFRVKAEPPYAQGVGMVQPSPIYQKLQDSLKPMVTALVTLFLIFVLRGITASNKVIFSDRFDVRNQGIGKEPVKTREFEITGRTSNIEFDGYTDVTNSWLFVDGLLVDAQTQKGIPAPLEISFYRGSDWKEGSRRKKSIINNVPPGRYYLSLKFQLGPRPPSGFFELIIRRDVPITSNFIVACFLILIAPAFSFLRIHSYEVKRWSNSDYSPYSED